MKKSTKGALAAAAAGTLLLGGAGSLAFWNDAQTVSGTDIASGHLKLVDANCQGWQIDGGAAYTTQKLVPGDTLTQTCTYKVDASGAHLKANFDVQAANLHGDAALTKELKLSAQYKKNSEALASIGTGVTNVAVVNNDTITVNLSIDWPYNSTDTDAVGGLDNESNSLAGFAATLDSITVTATQTHSAS